MFSGEFSEIFNNTFLPNAGDLCWWVPLMSAPYGTKPEKLKVWPFPGLTTKDMFDYIKKSLIRSPDNVILHTATNDSVDIPSRTMLDIVSLKQCMQYIVQWYNVQVTLKIAYNNNRF